MIIIPQSSRLAIASLCLFAVFADQEFPPGRPPSIGGEFEVELCDMPCQNNGKCVAFDSDNDGFLDPQCLCNTTFQGDLCETPRSCSLACENGGTCSSGDAWWLMLADDRSLPLLQEILYRCSIEGGKCEIPFSDQSGRCVCPFGTNGPLCENTCNLSCQNGGECIFSGSEQRCRCADNFYGDQCENVCSKGCLNDGVCLAYPSSDVAGGFEEQCICRAGFEGEQCETVTACPMSCQNEGACKFRESWIFEENREDGFILQYWQSMIERCTVRNLPIADCLRVEEPTPYCDCPPTTFGNTCGITCDLDCQNGSTCQFNGRDKFCPCEIGFAGDLCQFECTKGCVNGACNADATGQWCQCSPFFDGDLCETERACDKTCFNDGKCEFLEGFREYNEKYFEECVRQNFGGCPGPEDVQRCACTDGFVGNDCSQPCPCQNGGTCRGNYYNRKLEDDEGEYIDDQLYYEENEEEEQDDAIGYFCQCPFGHYGQNCQFKFDSESCELTCENGGYCTQDFAWNEDGSVPDDDQFGNSYNNNNNNNQNQNYYDYNNAQTGRQSNNNNNSGGATTDVPPTVQPPFEYCTCPEGFTGTSCETQIDACHNQCKNGGVCVTDNISTQDLGNRALQVATSSPTSAPVRRTQDAPTTPPIFAPTTSPTRPTLFPGSCSCPEGYSGDLCERKTCGSGYCSHGGSCIELPSGQTTLAGDDYVCDCSTSTLEETVGIGRNCDAIVYSTCSFFSSKMNPNEAWSCAGYGKCFKEGQDSIPQCSCDTTFTGPRCEFDINDPKDVAWSECSLECSNGGVCLKGATKPIADIFIPFTEGTKKSGLFDYQTPDFEYCYCPDGFFGVQCDKQYDICGNREHICFHGSKCKNDSGAWGCDCRGTESAGLYCQYKATDDCGDSNLDTFCTNEAACTLDSSSDALCTCVEGWEGTKCEIEVKLAAPSGGEGGWSSAPTLAGTLLSVLSVALLSVALVTIA
ncbi:unnamed protein product [Cylindrotheca closterium]|uniref:EGF-like domain-containing protein n=1 Tax=Cylindrotheca closterium TaxID=2856 RepID=A0AAD2CC95_9STRA|nr:unnamed protein product [Cylindrotheca closterium]